jgi:hypothetical protein
VRISLVVPLVALVACGGAAASRPDPASGGGSASAPSSDPAAAPGSSAASVADSTPAPAPAPAHLPTACADASAEVCTPASDFVDRLCARPHTDAALALFGKTTPFTRLYLRGKLDELVFDEEVLALRFHAQPKNGIQVGSGAGSYDVLRWDGTCSMGIEAEMITRTRPPRPKTAHVPWHRLGDKTQDALVAGSEAVKRAHARRGKECMGAMSGDVSAACQKADDALVDAVVEYVRGGGALPPPFVP